MTCDGCDVAILAIVPGSAMSLPTANPEML